LAAGFPPVVETHHVWSKIAIPDEPTAVDCGDALSTCWLTGTDDKGRVVAIDNVDERWTPRYPIQTRGATTALLTGIGCTSQTACWVIGSWEGDAPLSHLTLLLAQHWNGLAWSPLAVRAPTQFPRSSVFNAVSCAKDGFCVAIGLGGFEHPNSVPIAAVLSH
jgi:hypothetical protein